MVFAVMATESLNDLAWLGHQIAEDKHQQNADNQGQQNLKTPTKLSIKDVQQMSV
jgi:hypothetical protein